MRSRLGLLGLVLLFAASACRGDVDNDDFIGWVDAASGFIVRGPPDGNREHMMHTARFPCAGCYRALPSFEDQETVLRFTTPEGRTLVIKWTVEDLNAPLNSIRIGEIPPAVPNNGSWILPRATPGFAAAYLGPEPFEEIGVISFRDAVWPQAPGDVGTVALQIVGASFEGRPVNGELVLDLAMRRAGADVEGFGGLDEPCHNASCDDGLSCVVERDEMLCRRPCAFDSECDNGTCQQWPGIGGICRPAMALGELGGLCGDICNDETLVCADDNRCRARCEAVGFDPLCGGSSSCDGVQCSPTVEAGLANGPCRNNVCDLSSLVCVDEEEPTCRPICTEEEAASDDPCGIRFACAEREGFDAICIPANLELEPCPCDDHLVCVLATGDPAGGLCRRPCTLNGDGTDTCPEDLGDCIAQEGSPEDGVCIIPP